MTKIFQSIRNAYFRFFYWQLGKNVQFGEEKKQINKFAAFAALCFVSIIDYCNVLTLLFVGSKLLSFQRISSYGNVFDAVVILLIFALNSLLFLRNDQYKEIIKFFRNENEEQRYNRNIKCVLFLVFSIFSLPIAGIVFEIILNL